MKAVTSHEFFEINLGDTEMVRNAIILAAGKSDRFAPFTYEKPKGLFCVKGDVFA